MIVINVQTQELVMSPDGTCQFLWDDSLAELLELGAASIRRVSAVEPTLQGLWMCDLRDVGGPLLGPFRLRGIALAAERDWLRGQMSW